MTIDRRSFLQRVGVGGLVIAGASPFLAACGGSTKPATGSANDFAANSGTPGNPGRGGNLRVAMHGNGSSETYNPFISGSAIDTLRVYAVFDPMTRPAPYGGREPGLVTKWTPNNDATAWELTLRDGVRWHDGKPLTPEDLIYSLRTAAGPTSTGVGGVMHVLLDELAKTGKNTVRVPLRIPIADLEGYFIASNAQSIVRDGTTDYTNPIGTGPYKMVSFTPGERSVLSANRDYWDSPKPYPDQLELLSIDDPTARVNALQGGQVDLCLNLPFTEARANLNSSEYKVIVGHPGVSYTFYMRTDTGPFQDVRVRQAMKLIPDRQAMIDTALGGFGAVGNDLIAPGTPYFATSFPQRTQDIEQAKSLLKAAGAQDLRVTLSTAEVAPGFESAALVFAQQAKLAGVTIDIKREPTSQYLDPQFLYLKETFAQDTWPGPALNYCYSAQYPQNSGLNDTHWNDPSWDQLLYKAQAELNHDKAQELWNEVQKVQFDQGGNIVWAYWRSTDAASANVRGFGEPGSGWLYGTDDDRVWNWGLA